MLEYEDVDGRPVEMGISHVTRKRDGKDRFFIETTFSGNVYIYLSIHIIKQSPPPCLSVCSRKTRKLLHGFSCGFHQ